MPIDDFGPRLIPGLNLALGIKAFLILFLVFDTIFVLILFRQIQLMGKSLPTTVNPFLKFIAILQIGVALALLFVVIGVF